MILIIMSSLSFQLFYQIVYYQTFYGYPTLNKPLISFLEPLAFMIMSHSLQLPCKGIVLLTSIVGFTQYYAH
jgi:hypothetical protein